MKSEHKSKKRGRSSSPAKKKPKRKYRNDRSKKSRQSSSETTSSEEVSLTSDEYPSSGEERRKEAKKKRSKKVKRKSRASVSSSRSPSPEKVKKKSKSKEDKEDGKKDKHRKDRKRSSSSKKKRKRSRSGSGSSGSRDRSPVKKEKPKKKNSPSPVRVKKKKSVSPPPKKESDRLDKKKKKSVSPVRTKKKASPSPSRKAKRSRSPSPARNKKNKSPPHHVSKKKSVSPTPPRSKKKSVSPPPNKHKAKSKSPIPRGRKKSISPPPKKEKKATPATNHATKKSKSPTPNRPKKESQSPAPRIKSKSPTPTRPKKESQSPAPRIKSKSPTANRPRKKSPSPAPRKKSKSPTPNRPKKESQSPAPKKKSKSPSPNRPRKKSPSPAPRKKSKSPPPVQPEKKGKSPVPMRPVLKSPSPIRSTAKSPSPNRTKTDVEQAKKIAFPIPKPTISANENEFLDKRRKTAIIPILLKTKIDISIPSMSAKKDIRPAELKEKNNTISDKINTISEKMNTISDTPVVQAKDIKTQSPIVPEKKIPGPSTLKDVIPTPTKENGFAVLNILSKKSKSPSREKKNDDSPTRIKKSGSPSVFRSRKKSPSPIRNRKKSRSSSPSRTRKKSKSPSPTRIRRRSKSPKRERKRSRSRSPVRHRAKSPTKQRKRSRSRSGSPFRSKKDRDRSPDKKRKQTEDKRKDDDRDRSGKSDERSSDKKDEKDKEKSRRSDDHRRSRDDRSNKDDKDRRKKDDKELKSSKRDKSPEKKDITELEEEMKKRKERIEAWRNANRKKGDTTGGGETSGDTTGDGTEPEKKWSLEDDEDEEEEQSMEVKEEETAQKEESSTKTTEKRTLPKKAVKKKEIKEESEEDVDSDPLDMFMKGIDDEVNKLSGRNTAKPTNTGGVKTKTITVMKTVVNKTEEVKPEVMEQNQDALEYSSEEEQTNDIKASDFTDVTKKKKELTVADHTKIYYAPFRRNFYVEVPELTRMSLDEVKVLRDSLGDIQVRGKTIPKPIKTWAQAGLSSKVMNVLKKCQYEKPTPIQAQTLPVAMSGRDLIGIAKTGSGKTLAFVLPMLRHVLDQPALDEDDGPIAIIMTPTRELAIQIYRESKKFCKALNLNVTCIYGGSGISEQIAELKRGTEIIVCTPGRMIDMLAANNGRVTNCRRCTYLVLDEADRMFDMGFEPQVMRIIDNIRPDRQTILFSATFPRQMEAMARKVLTKPIEVQVGGRSIVCSDVEQHAMVLDEDNKFFKVLELLGVYQDQGSILLFVERQETADRLFKDLLKKGYPCLSLHGGMDQFDRDSTIADFKNGVTRIMVSTSVAARGLDVKNLNLVINYDCPNHYEDYVHRVGRTGRAGNKGTAFTFVTPEQGRNAGDIIKAFELSKCELPEGVLEVWNSFREDMEKEGKTIKMNSGFSGKGFKFNAEEDAIVNESKKMRKFALGLQDSDDEAEAAENAMDKIEADLDKIFSSKPKVALQPEVVEAQKVKAAEQNVDKDKLKQASSIAALINKKLSSGQIIDRNTAATAHIMQGGALESLTGVGLAKQLADKVNAKLNYKATEVEAQVAEKPAPVRYEEEIDINDFPQQARWRITSKEIIEQVRELSEAGVTVRGLYIPPNKKPTEEEKRLHLYIESLSERSIQIAKAEIKRLLKEELIKAESNTYRPTQQTGRYKVL